MLHTNCPDIQPSKITKNGVMPSSTAIRSSVSITNVFNESSIPITSRSTRITQ